jgi:NAD(P)-dependent dehydrogenase (short-subunit alcohol dehydrogenase family)
MVAARALVVGGASGLGAALAVKLAERGARVAVADRNAAGAESVVVVCRSAGGTAHAVIVDLASAEGPAAMVAAAVRDLGGLDIVVHCAAAAPAERFLDMTAEAWETALLVNVRGLALTLSAAGRAMASGGGRIIAVTSAASRMALPNYTAYAATKAAVDSLVRAAAVALAPHGISVNSLSPGMMDTPIQMETEALFAAFDGRADVDRFKAERTARIPLGRRTDPGEMADVLVWMALDAPAYMTAGRLNVTGGLDKD